MNIAGNMRQLWQQLAEVGSDPYPYSTYLVPSLVFDSVQFSGA
jgi:PmbA protein